MDGIRIQTVENLTIDATGSGNDVDDDTIQSLFAQATVDSFGTPSLDPDDLSYTRSQWDGSAALTNAPNPSDGEDAQQALRRMVALYPTAPDEALDNKANYKLPFRSSPDGDVNLNGVTAAIAAINGARGGVSGASEDELRDAFNFLVRLAVSGGVYEEREDAPEFKASRSTGAGGNPGLIDTLNQAISDATDDDTNRTDVIQSMADSAGLSANTVYEILNADGGIMCPPRQRLEGFSDALDVSISSLVDAAEQGGCSYGDEGSAQEFEPAREDEDGVPLFRSRGPAEQAADMVEGDCSGVHEVELDGETWFKPCQDDETALSAFGASASTPARSRITVEGAGEDFGDDGLTGVVWAAGEANMYVNGEPTKVWVPPESIPHTFNALKSAVQSGHKPAIGLDHGDSLHRDTVPIASELDVLTIGEATDFALSEDGEKIVLTESNLKPDFEAKASDLGQYDFSMVGTLRIHRDDDGQPITRDGRLVVTAELIEQIDVVRKGAVPDATITADLPPLQQAASSAAAHPTRPATAFKSSLRAMAKRTDDLPMQTLEELDLDDASPSDVYGQAEQVVEAKDERIQQLRAVAEAAGIDPEGDDVESEAERLKAHAEAVETLADHHDVDLDEDGVAELIDEHTEGLRHDVAKKEATLPGYAVGTDDGPSVEDRADDLKGTSPGELEAMNGKRATEILETEEAREQYARGFASGDGQSSVGGGQQPDDDAEAFAKEAMTAHDAMEFADSDTDSAVEFMAKQKGEEPDPAKYDSPGDYIQAVNT